MKKTLLLTAVLFSFAANAQTHHVNVEQAQLVATNFWQWHNTTPFRNVTNAKAMTFEGIDQLHVFDFDGKGFVIVPADDRVMQVLAYSFEDPFPSELNPEVGYWLRNYNTQIAAIAKSNAPRNTQWNRPLLDPAPDSTVNLTGIPTMLTTKWNQNDPYDKFCPYDSLHHDRTVVGCVATAMAQIMKYWNYPAYGQGSHSYEPPVWYSSYDFGTLSADFGNTTYLWEYMPDELDNLARTYQRDAVATLSYHCGVAVEMMYGISSQGGSGAFSACGDWRSYCAENAFKQFFKYDTSDYHATRDFVNNDSLWCALIDEQLALGHPVYYDGRDVTGGHAFVLDGSDTAGRYHFNMGWGGSGNGYYSIDNIAPDSGGIGGNASLTFNMEQGAIFNIMPAYEETFDTADYYDTTCNSNRYINFYEHRLLVADTDTILRHLSTYYRYHLKVINPKKVFLNPNISGELPISVDFCPSELFTLPQCSFTNEGLVFSGWCRVKTGNDTIYQPGQQVKLYANTTFFAIWADSTLNAGIEDLEHESLRIWPNPTSDEITIAVPTHTGTIIITDVLGRTVLRDDYPNIVSRNAKISLQTLPNGVYTVQVKTAIGTYKQRIIKR